jgi:hypothetical protein
VSQNEVDPDLARPPQVKPVKPGYDARRELDREVALQQSAVAAVGFDDGSGAK